VACGDAVTGELTPEDTTGFISPDHAHDAYSFEATGGEYVDITMEGFEVPSDDSSGSTPDPLLVLLDATLEPIAWDDDSGGGLNARITARLPDDGEYILIATSWGPETYFGYALEFSCREQLEPDPIECGERISGELTPDDETGIRTTFGDHPHDAYTFEGSQGESVTILMQADRGYDDEFAIGLYRLE
jgi:serine protease Do